MKRPTENLRGTPFVLISLGGLIFAIICILTVQDLSDQTFKRVFLPGLFMALPLLIAGIVGYYFSIPQRRPGRVLKSHRL